MITQNQSYYTSPYGMTMPGRNGSIGSKYRYAFNGMEADGEVSGNGNSYTTQFRQYDPRLGRWKSLDPLAFLFLSQTPYSSMDNNPIRYNDIKGDSVGMKDYDQALLLTNDLNAFFKKQYGVEGAFEIVKVNGYMQSYERNWISAFCTGNWFGTEFVDEEIWAIVPNRNLTQPNGASFWDTDKYTQRTYDIHFSNGMSEVKFSEKSYGKRTSSWGTSREMGIIWLYYRDLELYADENTDNSYWWTIAGTYLHEIIFHKHPDSRGEKAEEMQDKYDLPTKKRANHPGGNVIDSYKLRDAETRKAEKNRLREQRKSDAKRVHKNKPKAKEKTPNYKPKF